MFKYETTYGEGIRRSLAAPVWRSLSGVKSQIFSVLFRIFWEKVFYVNVICTRYGSVFCRRTQKRVEKRPSGQWVSAAGEVLAPPPPHFEGARELKSGQSTQDRKMKKTLYCYSHQQPSALRNPADRSELNKIISY